MAETGPVPDTRTCGRCDTPIGWLWSPRVNKGHGGWVMFERVSDDGFTIRSHRCEPPRGEFDYQGSEESPTAPNWPHARPDQPDINHQGRLRVNAAIAIRAGARPSTEESA